MSSLPALLIGGPPHRGKSVLSYILSKRLKTRHVDHYLIRITPDAEGNWYYEGNFAHTSQLRNAHKRAWDEAFELSQSQILENRPLPLLVDGGGQPTDSQVEELFGKCSHALLLCASEAEFVQWRQIAARAGLPVVGEVTSSLLGQDRLMSERPLRLRLTGLCRENLRIVEPDQPVWQALFERVEATIQRSPEQLWDVHCANRPEGTLAIHCDAWLRQARPDSAGRWEYSDLPALLASLPTGQPLALYAAKAQWLATALALPSRAPITLFDARLGWLPLPTLRPSDDHQLWKAMMQQTGQWPRLDIVLSATHLDYAPILAGPLPDVPADGLVLGGKGPHWLFAAIARHYAKQGKAIAFYLPREERGLVVHGADVGQMVALQTRIG